MIFTKFGVWATTMNMTFTLEDPGGTGPQNCFRGWESIEGLIRYKQRKQCFLNVSPQIKSHSTDAALPIRMTPHNPGKCVCVCV